MEGEEKIDLLPNRVSSNANLYKTNSSDASQAIVSDSSGLNTRQALQSLEKILNEEQERFFNKLCWKSWLTDALHHNSSRSIFNWTELILLLLQLTLAIITLSIQDSDTRHLAQNGEILAVICILTAFLLVNLSLSCWEARSRHLELWKQVVAVMKSIRQDLQASKKMSEWKPSYYPHLHTPDSPCISLQWTYRDNILVNLPAVLLVPYDIILVRPSQKLFCKCKILDEDADETTRGLVLNQSDTFQPNVEGEIESPAAPVERTCALDRRFVVLEPPFRKILQESLSKKPLERPSSMIEKQRIVILGYIQRRLLPVILLLYFIGNIVKICAFTDGFKSRWPEEFLYANIYVLLPLSPLIFPSFWLGVNFIVLARVLSVFQKFRKKKLKHEYLHEAKLTDSIYIVKADWLSTWKRFRSFVQGTNESLYQTSNIVHTLGNVTSVCCIDKKGILSWPNPNAEKLCVLRARGESASASKTSLRQSASSLQEIIHIDGEAALSKSFDRHTSLSVFPQELLNGTPEVLDITQSGGRAFDIDFDDPGWMRLLTSLKPLGLGILLNTCNKDCQEYYREFTDHVSCVAFHHDQTVPVLNRRCLCSLSQIIGFKKSAESIFKQYNRIAFYRKPGKTPREQEGRYKTPFPNMLSIIVQDTKSGGLQVMSQGTADLVLDSCTDYWNGQEVRPLSEEDRKQIMEFYTRFSMTAYCTAFAYSPMTVNIPEQESDSDPDNDDIFIELPVEDDDSSIHEVTSQISVNDDSNSVVKDLYENCCRNQIFLGCVAQQYQSRNEFVHLIDLLEQACIRFIHFSPETELRSRVFAERLGLESGWNCHISLDSHCIDPTSFDQEIQISSEPETTPRKTVPKIVVEPEIDLENRSRLPRGIENIRDHITSVDNVPLLVSLFTDSSPASIKEMIAIMQENGEVVCCLGSSASLSNCSVFLQADASIAIEPMYPQVCFTSETFNPSSDRRPAHLLPTELMRVLTSLNCSLSCRKEDPLSLMQLVIESRHNLSVLRNCFKYLISAGLFLITLHTISNLMCLPPCLSLGHLLLLVCLSVPLLSLALLSAPHDRNLMRISTGKNSPATIVDKGTIFRFVRTFLFRWFPSILIIILCEFLILSEHCHEGAFHCYPILSNLSQPKATLKLTQNFSALLVIFYFAVISMGYGNNKPGFWKYSPLKNTFWILAMVSGFLLQLIYFLSDTPGSIVRRSNSTLTDPEMKRPGNTEWRHVPLWVWLTGFLWPILLLPLNELIKKFELAEMDKLQKRARLQFGTKLGMNSPF